MNKTKLTDAQRQEDIKNLKYLFEQAETNAVYVVQVALKDKNHPDGDQKRYLKLFVIGKDKYPMNITRTTAELLEWEYKDECIIAHGCGMDMHFHTVYSLSQVLYGFDHEGAYKLKHYTL